MVAFDLDSLVLDETVPGGPQPASQGIVPPNTQPKKVKIPTNVQQPVTEAPVAGNEGIDPTALVESVSGGPQESVTAPIEPSVDQDEGLREVPLNDQGITPDEISGKGRFGGPPARFEGQEVGDQDILASLAITPEGKGGVATPAQGKSGKGLTKAEKIAQMAKAPLSKNEKIAKMAEVDRGQALKEYWQGIGLDVADFIDTVGTNRLADLLDLLPGGDESQKASRDSMKSLMREFGMIPNEGEEPDSAAFRVGRVVGSSLPLIPGAALINKAKPLTEAGKQALKNSGLGRRVLRKGREIIGEIGETIRKKPITSTAIEAGLATTSGVGMEIARQQFPDSTTAEVIGGLIGGGAPGLALGTGKLVTRNTVKGGKWLKNQFFPTNEGAQRAAGNELREAAKDPVKALQSLEKPGLLAEADDIATVAQKSNDEGLLALERSIMEKSNRSLWEADDQVQRMVDAVDDVAKPDVSAIDSTRATFKNQNDYINNLYATRSKMAGLEADNAIAKIGPKITQPQANTIVRQKINEFETAARATERQIWQKVPKETPVTGSNSTNVMRELIKKGNASRTFKGLEKLPSDLELGKFLGKAEKNKAGKSIFKDGSLTKKATLGELQDLRSDVLSSIRQLRSEKGSDKLTISILEDFQEALLQDMGAISGIQGTAGGDQLRLALTVSRKNNETFGRGILGRFKGVDKAGTASIPESVTLESVLTGNSAKSAQNFRDIKAAVQDNPDLIGASENFLKTDFQKRFFRGGKMNTDQAKQYMKTNKEVLDEFPRLRDDLQKAIDTGDVSSVRARKSEAMAARVSNPKISKATLYIEKEPGKAFESLRDLRSGSFQLEVNNLISRAKKDATGEAFEGLQESLSQWILDSGRTSQFTSSGQRLFSAGKLSRAINDPHTAAMMGNILTPGQVKRLREFQKTVAVMEKAKSAKGIDSPSLIKGESKLLSTVAQIGGAATGRALNTGTIQTPGIMASRFRELVAKIPFIKDPIGDLIKAAINDDSGELMKTLLMKADTPKDAQFVTRKLWTWVNGILMNAGEPSLAEIEE